MKNAIKNIIVYSLILAGGLAVGNTLPRVYAWLKPAYEEGDYRAYFPNPQTKVVLYSTSWCGYCAKTRAYLQQKNIAYVDLDIEKDKDAAQQHVKLGGGGVPKLLIGNRKIQGFAPDAIDEALKLLPAK